MHTEAALVQGIPVYGLHNLKEVVRFIENPSAFQPVKNNAVLSSFAESAPAVDFCDVKGQAHVKRALEIAAAGAHNILLSGPPGCGKTLMAKAMPGIMPKMTIEEALEATRIHSIAGMLPEGQSLLAQRPFRSPHHTISYAGLIGGGPTPAPERSPLPTRGSYF